LTTAISGRAGETAGLDTRRGLRYVCLIYLLLSAIFGSLNLDIDEFGFVREPYELLGGDYTVGYLKRGQYALAAHTFLESYYFYWKYRPLFSPIVSDEDKKLFEAQELEFGYTKPGSVSKSDTNSLAKYGRRLIVPEPDRFYSHGAGKPLLSAIVSIPQGALVKLFTTDAKSLLYYQYNFNYHPIFILTRLAQIIAGLVTILVVYWILSVEGDPRHALLGAAIAAFFPTSMRFFPNLHHDALLTPFVLLATYFFYKAQYKRAGLFFGLALASKNTAILLLPVFVIWTIIEAWSSRRRTSSSAQRLSLQHSIKGILMVSVIGLVVLLPFANPISYVREILTPITHRAYDSRGENVEQFTLSNELGETKSTLTSEARPEIQLVKMFFRFDDDLFFFLTIAIVLFWSQRQDRLERLMFLVLLLTLPYGLEFGSSLSYRALLFVPFFAILCARISPSKYLVGLVVLLLFVDVLYCVDPMTTDYLHYPVSKERLWPTLTRSILNGLSGGSNAGRD
jgi:Dolichyl-phosphate-mannose-protein mannosyltransferase